MQSGLGPTVTAIKWFLIPGNSDSLPVPSHTPWSLLFVVGTSEVSAVQVHCRWNHVYAHFTLLQVNSLLKYMKFNDYGRVREDFVQEEEFKLS